MSQKIKLLNQECLCKVSIGGNLSCLKYIHKNIGTKKNDYWILAYTAKSGIVECFKYAYEIMKMEDNGQVLNYAALSGNLNCLKYAHKCQFRSF